MTDTTGTNVQATSQTETVNEIPVELRQQMETSLAGFVPGTETPNVVPHENGSTQTTPEAEVQNQQQQAAEPFSILKEKFGWQDHESALKEVEELRAFKATPPAAAELKFENPISEQIVKALQAGKTNEVTRLLVQQERLETLTTTEVTKETAADIIKMGMQLKYKDLTPSEVEYRYNKQFAIPKEPVQGDSELDEDFAERKAQWQEKVSDIEMEKMIEAKLNKPELELAKSKIVFPEIPNQVDEGYTQYRKMLEEQPQLDAAIKEAYGKFTPKTIETKIKFTDEPNKIDFEFQHEPDGESFQKTIEVVSDFDKLVNHFKLPDGTPDREGFARAMYFALNANKVLTEAMKQSKNATIKSFLPDNTSGTQRQFPQTQELSELDKQMKASLNGFVPA